MEINLKVKLAPCPHCGSDAELVDIFYGYAIVCTDKNCFGGMRIKYGSCDDRERFLNKLITDWNKRDPDTKVITEAIECIEKYRGDIYDETQEEYDEHGSCCVDVLDEVLNRLRCFTSPMCIQAEE